MWRWNDTHIDHRSSIMEHCFLDPVVVEKYQDLELVRIVSSVLLTPSSSKTARCTSNKCTPNKLLVKTAVEDYIETACHFLEKQWPRGGPYRNKIIPSKAAADTSGIGVDGLPSSYLLLKVMEDNHNKTCIGHGRLTECFEGAGGNAAAATFILIHQSSRGRGYGRILMQLLENEARRLGYHYIYLWTRTAIPFYTKLGYSPTHRVSLYRACLKQLNVEQISSLDQMLRTRAQTSRHESMSETILLLPEDDDSTQATDADDDVWLKKRLVEQVGSVLIPLHERLDEFQAFLLRQNYPTTHQAYYSLVSVAWQPQIGPSCGLAALRMVRDYYYDDAKNDDDDGDCHANLESEMDHKEGQGNAQHKESQGNAQQRQWPSLLSEAREQGYSIDGEVFNAHNLVALARSEGCGRLKAKLESFQNLDPVSCVHHVRTNNVYILPYDANPRTKLPGKFQGQHAHYGIIVGVLLLDQTISAITDDNAVPNLHSLDQMTRTKIEECLASCCHDDIYLLVQHSLARSLAIASWTDFVQSNRQLTTMDTTKSVQKDMDLQDRLIVLMGRQGQNTD